MGSTIASKMSVTEKIKHIQEAQNESEKIKRGAQRVAEEKQADVNTELEKPKKERLIFVAEKSGKLLEESGVPPER